MIAEGDIINVEAREKIPQPYFIENKSIREIAQEVDRSRAAVRKAIASAQAASYTLKVPRPAPVLAPYKDAHCHNSIVGLTDVVGT